MKTAAIFGGSFDPPHNGHLSVIRQALDTLDIDTLIVMPNFLNPFKHKTAASARQRLQWLETMTAKMDKVTVSDYEIRKGYAVPTVETVTHFLKEYDKIYFIIGADNVKTLHKWKDYERLKALVTFVVATRKGGETKDFTTLAVNRDISSTQMRQKPEKEHIPPSIYSQVKEVYERQN